MRIAFVNGRQIPLALRELQTLARSETIWGSLAVISIVVVVAGPFGTYGQTDLVHRLLYWVPIVVGTFYAAAFSLSISDEVLVPKFPVRALAKGLGAAIAAVPVSAVVLLMGAAFSQTPSVSDVAVLYLQSALIVFGIDWLLDRANRRAGDGAAALSPGLLRRLPPGKRGSLVRLHGQDHYVEVVTDRGRELVLLRLKDAVVETSPEAGFLVHRSHWVARRAVVGSESRNGRRFLKLIDGTEVPVSRHRLKAAREAGLFS